MRGAALAAALIAFSGCGGNEPTAPSVGAHAELSRLSEDFQARVIRVGERVHVAVGFGLANSIMIEGDDGLIIVDTMESMAAAGKVRAAFSALSDKPVVALIYTHNHSDHVLGAAAFVDPATPPDVYAHDELMPLLTRIVTEFRPIIGRRSFRMFGNLLDDAAFGNNGIGPRLAIGADSEFSIVAPTITFGDGLSLTRNGVKMELIHAPGETADQILVWLPDDGILLPGDNIYKAFPNLYTIRGTAYRSPKQWAASLDRMRDLGADHLVPSHGLPLSGADQIAAVLTDYRDAIRFVHDQSIRWINAGLTPDEIVERVRLPAHLARSPWLQEYYGTVEWSARSVFSGNLGWFNGNPSALHPLPPAQRAARMSKLAGGPSALRAALDRALESDDHQWALELSDWLTQLQPENSEVRDARVQALLALGEASGNPNARHYYLSSGLELRGDIEFRELTAATPAMLDQIPLQRFFDALAVSLRAEKTLQLEQTVGFSFSDSGEHFSLHVRRGVLEIRPRMPDKADLHVKIDSLIWKQLLAKQKNPALVIARDVKMLRGNKFEFTRFMSLFRS